MTFQSTHPLRGATLERQAADLAAVISIHAPLAGCDNSLVKLYPQRRCNFNPRTPCGVRPGVFLGLRAGPYFNPRTPCGVRRLHPDADCAGRRTHFNPRTPCGVRPRRKRRGQGLYNFNPRTPCGVRLLRILYYFLLK